jgi:hypothetical protein
MAEDVRVLHIVMLGQVHVEICRPPRLLRVMTERPGSPGGGGMHQHLLRSIVHEMTDHERSTHGRIRPIVGIGIDLLRGLLDGATHHLYMGDPMSELDHQELRGMRAGTSKKVLDEATSSAVPTSSDPNSSEPEPGAVEVEVGRPDGMARRHRRSTEIKGVAQRIRHSDCGPRPGVDPDDVLSHRDIEKPVSIGAFRRYERSVDPSTA